MSVKFKETVAADTETKAAALAANVGQTISATGGANGYLAVRAALLTLHFPPSDDNHG